ncbi:Rib/alpha-like domain-containing protein [Streptococcus suis]|uniref:Rib/alpha-like domain-containing protein n=1 Tax=Streptococcus suis TaxID=1307 RepID=UPI00137A8D21|nr:Rib/alpha-like domain-containing protein [Streptococcus suis]
MFKIKRNKLNRQEAFNFEKRSQFGIRKLTIGVVSLVIGSGMVLSGVEQVQAGTDYDPGVEIRYVRNGSPKALASDGDFKIEKSFVEVNGVQYVDVTLTFNQDHDGYARRFLYFNMPKSLYEPEKITRELYWQGERTPRETTEYRTWQGDYRFADEPWYRLWDHRYIIGSPDSLQGERHKKVTSPTDPGGDTIGGQSEGRWNGDWDRLMFSVPNNAGSGKEALTKAASDFKATSRTVYINRFSGSTDKHVYKFRARVKDGNAPMNFVVGLNEESGSHANFLAQYGTTPDTRTLAEKSTITPPTRLGVSSLQDLNAQTQNTIKQNIQNANPELFNGTDPLVTNVTVSSDGVGGNATLHFKDGSQKTIPMNQLVYKTNNATGGAPTASQVPTKLVDKSGRVGLQGEDHQLNLPAKIKVDNIATIEDATKYSTQWNTQVTEFLKANTSTHWSGNGKQFFNAARLYGSQNWKAEFLTAKIKYVNGSNNRQIQGIEVSGPTKEYENVNIKPNGKVNMQVYGLLTPAMLFYQEDPLKTTKDEAKATIDSIGNINGKAADWKSRIDAAQNQQAIEAIITEARNEKNALDKKKAAAIQEINALPHLSQNEKTAAINAINSATTTTVVDQKLNDAKALNTTNMRNKGKEAINALSKLNDGEKTPYRNRIDNATTQDQINAIIEEAAFEDLKRSALEQLDNMNPAPSNKDELRAQITETNFNTVSSDGKKPAERIEAILERAKAEVLRDQARRDINAISGLPEEKKNEFLGIVDRAQTPSEITNAVDQARAYSDYIQAKDAINQLTNINNKQKEELLAGLERDKSQQGVADMLTSARALDGEMKHLKDLVAQAETIKQSSDYSRADRAKQNTFNTALDAAKRVSPQTGELPTTSVGQLISNLTDAIRGLGGTTQPVTKDVDKGNLRAEIDRSSQVKAPANAEYTYASEDKKQAYEQALTQAIAVRDKANPVATQAEVDAALAKLQEARIALDGHAPERVQDTLADSTDLVVPEAVQIKGTTVAEDEKQTIIDALKAANPGKLSDDTRYEVASNGVVTVIYNDGSREDVNVPLKSGLPTVTTQPNDLVVFKNTDMTTPVELGGFTDNESIKDVQIVSTNGSTKDEMGLTVGEKDKGSNTKAALISGKTDSAIGKHTRKLRALDNLDQASAATNDFYVRIVDATVNQPETAIEKAFDQALTPEDVRPKINFNVGSGQDNLIDFEVIIPTDAPTSGQNKEVSVIIRTKAHANAPEDFKRTFVSQDKTVTVRATWPTQAAHIEVAPPADTAPALIDSARPTTDADKTALINALKEANKTPEGASKFPENTDFNVAENGAVTITYPDRSSETVTVPFKQKDSAQHTPVVTETPINSAATANTPLTEEERNAVKAAVTVPTFTGDRQPTVTVPADARVTNGTEGNTGKPVVVATVEYPDGSSENVEVPVRQRDNAKYEATVTNPEAPAAIKASHETGTQITDQADKDAILAKVSVPTGSNGTPSLDQNPVVEEQGGKPVVKVIVTYPDQTTDTVYVPVDQKDNEAHNPTAPAEAVKLDAPATANSTLSDDDKNAIKAAVTVPANSGGQVSLAPDAKVELVNGNPVVKATVTYPDGTTDIVEVPVVQKDSTKYDATAKETPVPLDSPVTPGQTLSAEEREALKFGVNVPAGSNGEIHVPDNAAVKLVGDKPVVEAEVRYPDGTVDKVQVPVRQYDRAVYTPNLVETKEVPISVEPTNGTSITSPDDASILANVDVPAAAQDGTKPRVDKAIASPVKDGTGTNQGKKVVEVEITYPDKSKEKIEVPVKHADNQVHNPEAPTRPVQLDVAATTDTSLSDADKQAVKDAVTIPQGSGGVASLPEDAKVELVGDKPVVKATVTYPDGTTDIVDVPVVQKDSTKYDATASTTPVPLDSPVTPGQTLSAEEREALKFGVNVPAGSNGEIHVPENAAVKLDGDKPVVEAEVRYPDGTVDKVQVPVRQYDRAVYTPNLVNPKEVPISVEPTNDTQIASPDDAAILANVDVPAATPDGTKPKVTKTIVSPVKDGTGTNQGKKVVEVEITYPDKSKEKIEVPVKHADNQVHNPEAPAKPVQLDVAATTDTSLSDADKQAVKDAVTIPQGSGGVASLPEDAKVVDRNGTPVVPVTVTYPDGTTETVDVPVVQKDSTKHTPVLTEANSPVLTDTPAKANEPVQEEDKAAIAAKVDKTNLPQGTETKVPDDAVVELENGKPVVPVLVSYPDGTSEIIKVPVDQKDSETYTPTAPAAEAPVAITGSDAPDAPIAEADKPAILNSVTVPAVDGGQAPEVTKEITSPVKVVDGKAFVEVTVTYPDKTSEVISVPVNQKDNEANNPTVTAPEKPAPISVPVAENTPVESDADKKLITDKVNVAGLPNPPQSVKVAEPAKVVMDQAGNPVVNVEVTYPDGTKDIVPVPVKQADNQTNTPSLKEPELGKPAEALVAIDPTPGVAITNQADKDAAVAKVDLSKLPVGTTAAVADGAVVANDPLTNKPVVPVTVTYPDGTSEIINVPVKQADNLALDPSLKDTNPVPILTEATVGLTVSDKANLDAIAAKVDPKTGKAEVVNNTIVAGKEDGPHAGQPVVNVLVTYPDGTQDTIEVPVKQADNVANEPSLTDQIPVPIQAAATTGTPVPADDKPAILAKVDLPAGAEATIADDATVVREDGQAVVPVTVTYPDGTTDTISVPVKRADNSKYTPSQVMDTVQVDAATAPGTAITSQDVKDAIIAAVTVPKVAAGEKAPVVSLPENPQVEVVNAQPVVKAIVTYADGTTDTVDVPIVQKVSATKEPSLKETEPGKPAQAVITENPTAGASITDPADQNVILDKVVVPEGGKASIADDAVVEMDGDQPVLPVTVTYTDGSKDIIKVPVKQADNVAKEPSLKSQTPVGVMDAPAVGAQVEEPADLEAIKNNVDTKGGTASIEDPTIVEGPNHQPAVAVKVTYPDGTADTILVPIKTADNVTYTPVLKSTDPVLVSVATDNGTAVPEADQAKILANVDVPALTADGDKPAVDLSIENPVVLQKNGQAGVEVTVTYPDGSKDKIFVPVDTDTDKDGFSNKEEEKAGTSATDPASTPDGQDSAERLNPGLTEPVEVKNPDKLTDAEKEAVKKAVEASNDLPAGTTVSVANDGTVTVTYPDNSTDTIQPKDAVTQFVDTDGDGISDRQETENGTDPSKVDSDNDGFSDKEEVERGTDPTKADSKPASSETDTDGDGISNEDEATRGTDPNKSDTDGDGFSDQEEITAGSNPTKADSTPANVDKDGDGFTDTEEAAAGTDANNPSSTPEGQDSAERLNPGLTEPVEVKNSDKLTDAEKEAVKKAVEDSNDLPAGTTVSVANDGTVTVTYPDKSTDTIQPAETVKVAKDTDKDGFTDTEEATAGTSATDPSSTPAGQDSAGQLTPSLAEPVEVKNPDKLTDAEKESVKKAVEDSNDLPEGTEVTVSDNGTVTVTYPDKSTDTIQPAETVKVAKDTDKDGFTDTEEATAGTSATDPSSTPAGQDSADRLNPGLTEPVEVKNPDKLTDAEKESVKRAVEETNDLPAGTEVSVSDSGTVTVTYPDKSTDTIQPAETVKVAKDTDKDGFTDTEEATAGTDATNPSSTPAGQDSAGQLTPSLAEPVEVKNPDKLTDAEKESVKKAVEDSNDLPEGTEVSVSDNGTVTVTYPDKSTDTIQPAETVKVAKDTDKDGFTDTEEEKAGTNATDPSSTPAGQDSAGQLTPGLTEPVEVKNPDKLTDAEKDAVKKAVEDSNDLPEGTEVTVSDNGTVTVTYPDKSTDTIQPAETVKVAKDTDKDGFTDTEEATAGTDATNPASTPAGQDSAGQLTPSLAEPVEVKNPDKLTDAEKDAVKKAVEDSNDLPEGTEVTVSDNGTVTVTYPDKSTDTIQPAETVKVAKDTDKDGFTDTEEEKAGTNATDPSSTPAGQDSAGQLTPSLTEPVEVKNPDKLTDAEKEAVKKAVEDSNDLPEGTEVTVSDNGTVTVTYPDKSADTIQPTDTVKAAKPVSETPVAPSKPEVTATDSGAVVVTPPTDNVTNLDITFTPEGASQPVTVVVSKDENGIWTAPADSGLVINSDGTITIPAEKVADGTAVTVVAENGSISSPEVGSTVVPVPAVTPETPVAPSKPEVTATDSGAVVVTPPTDNVTNLDITFTPEGSSQPVTVVVSKDATGTWTAPADSGLVVNPDGTITIPAENVADGTAVTVVAENGSVSSPEVGSAVVPVPTPELPAIPAKPTSVTNADGSVTIVPPVENVTGLDITFTPEGATEPVTVTLGKDATGAWTAPADSGLVVNPDGTITIPADRLADGTEGQVGLVAKNGDLTSNDPAPQVPETPAKSSVETNENGSVTIVPPVENVTGIDITFTPEGASQPVTVVVSKDATGAWTAPADSGLVVNPDGTITIPADKVADGTAVSVVTKNGQVPSDEASATYVPAKPASTDTPVVEVPATPSLALDGSGNVLITPPAENATSLDITFTPAGSETPITVTANKDATGNWILPETSIAVVNPDGTISISTSEMEGGTAVSVVAKNEGVPSSQAATLLVQPKQTAEELAPTVKKPIAVEDASKLTDAEKKELEDVVRKDNVLPEGTEVSVADDGTVTVTYPDKSTDTILPTKTVMDAQNGKGTSHSLPAYDLTADEDKDGFTNEEELKQGSNVADAKSVPAGKSSAERLTPTNDLAVKVKDLTKLSDAEKETVETAIRKDKDLPEGTQIEVANDGSVTITYPDGSIGRLPADQTVLQVAHGEGTSHSLPAYDLTADEDKDGFTNEEELKQGSNVADAKSVPAGKSSAERLTPTNDLAVKVKDLTKLTDAEKKAVETAIRKNNTLPEGTQIEVANDGSVTITYPDGSVDQIVATKVVATDSTVSPDSGVSQSSGTTKVLPGSASSTRAAKKPLPATGENGSPILVLSGLALLAGVAMFRKAKREDEN